MKKFYIIERNNYFTYSSRNVNELRTCEWFSLSWESVAYSHTILKSDYANNKIPILFTLLYYGDKK